MSNEPLTYVVAHNVVHLRAKPTNDSEQASQTLMGRTLTGLWEEKGWVWSEGDDTYRGWADKRWLVPNNNLPLSEITSVFAELRTQPDDAAPLLLRLSILTAVHRTGEQNGDFERVLLPDGVTDGWLPLHSFVPLPVLSPNEIAPYAATRGRDFLGTPYLWGGSSSFGLDCSGFVQLCYRLAGIHLRRDADIQRDDPRWFHVEQSDLAPGDLVFFGTPERITHVGMHFADNLFLHAAGGAGVILTEWGDARYSPGYVDARRLDPKNANDLIVRFEAEDR